MTISNIEMYNHVSRHLESSHIVISSRNEWFKQCVNFFMSDNPNCDAKDLSSMVAEQLSLSDFQEISLSSLPADLNNCDKTVLNGKYCLQVNTILDVGHSCYSQYNVVVKRDTSNMEIGDTTPAHWEPKSHRMLKMVCTDGQQDIIAMEYEPLPCLKEPFIPGFKIGVVGPVEYRKGVLLLKCNNVHFIGGEVEHLLIKNAPLNVLCKVLNKPELENPYMFSNIEVENTAMETLESRAITPTRQVENVNGVNIIAQNTRVPQNSTNQSNNSNFVGKGVITYDDFFDGDDDDFLYLTQVAEIETGLSQSDNIVKSAPKQTLNEYPHNNTSTKVNKPTGSVPKIKIEPKQMPTTTVRQTKISDILRPSTSKLVTSSITEPTKRPNDWSGKSHSHKAVEQPSGKRLASSPVHAQPKRSLIEPHIPEEIWDNMDMDVDVSIPLMKVLKFASVVKNSKIQVKQNKWICSGIVVDESKYEVEFSSDVLESLIGISSEEVLQLKNNNPLNCASLKEKIEKGIKGAYRKLHLFKGEMTLTYSLGGDKKPTVTDMTI